MNEINVSINNTNLNKILNYARAAYEEHKAEIGGMAVCVKGEDNNWEIKDPVILKQEITATNCALDKESLADYYLDVKASNKYKNKDWRFLWWHSHHMMDAFWSGTDLTAIDEFSEGDLSFALVVNLKGDYIVRASAWNLGMHQDIDLTTCESIASVPKRILDEVEDKCATRSFVGYGSNKNSNQLSMSYNTLINIDKPTKEEETFKQHWEETTAKMDDVITDVCSGSITLAKMKTIFAGMNGVLTKNHTGIRIASNDIHSQDDLLTIQPYDLLEVDKKFSVLHEELCTDAMDFYSYNWSFGLNRRYN